jgi:hypothetical protein
MIVFPFETRKSVWVINPIAIAKYGQMQRILDI